MIKRALRRWTVLAALFVAVSGCYMPIRFDAEIEITRQGYYKFFFDGYLAKVDLYQKIQKNEITLSEEKEWIEKIRRDLERDPSTKEFQYFKKGHFKVNWHREGDLVKTRSVTFLRRNENLLGVDYNNKTGRISVNGRSLKRDTKRQLHEMGLGWTGQIRVITDARVISHNATGVKKYPKRGPNFRTYTWVIRNIFERTPSMILSLR